MKLKPTEIIMRQLGGPKFVVMTGAKDFVDTSETCVQFKFRRGAANKANAVRISMAGNDTYSVEFFNLRGKTRCALISSHDGLDADGLARLFTEQTGMAVSLY
jgi:hypothetical protein